MSNRHLLFSENIKKEAPRVVINKEYQNINDKLEQTRISLIYDYPEYYETAFSFRDIAEEAKFLQMAISKFSQIEVRNILEIASGPAPHAGELVKAGYSFTGLDINKKMIKHAEQKWRDIRASLEFIEADMQSFSMDNNKKFDFAFLMLGSLYVKNQKEMENHFDSMADCLNKGALYFLDSCIQLSDPEHHDKIQYTIEKNGVTINSRFDIKLLDKNSNLYEEIWTLNINDNGRHKRFEMIEKNEALSPEKFIEFISQRNDFELVGNWLNWDFETPFDPNEKSSYQSSQENRSVAILRKL